MTDKEKIIKLENELIEARKKLTDFIYVVSHDLKEPVRGMKNYIKFTLEDFEEDLNEEGVQNLKDAVDYGDRFDLMMDRLLVCSRLNSNPQLSEKVSLAQLISEKARLLDVYESCEINGDAQYFCDLNLMNILVEEIINNAFKFNESEKKELEINIIDESSALVLEFIDNGIGIEERHFDEVFKVYSQLNSKNKYGKSSGMGMTIVKEIMTILRGEITLESVFGEKTKVILTFRKD